MIDYSIVPAKTTFNLRLNGEWYWGVTKVVTESAKRRIEESLLNGQYEERGFGRVVGTYRFYVSIGRYLFHSTAMESRPLAEQARDRFRDTMSRIRHHTAVHK